MSPYDILVLAPFGVFVLMIVLLWDSLGCALREQRVKNDVLRAEVERLRERCLEHEAEACGRMGHRDGLSRDRGPFSSGGQLDVAWRRGWDERSASVAEVERLRELLLNAGWPREADGIAELAQQAERAAVVAWLERAANNGNTEEESSVLYRHAHDIERGEHRRKENE